MALTKVEVKTLKAKAHHLTPVAQLGGNGMTTAFIDSVEAALAARELIKVKVGSSSKKEDAAKLAEELKAELVTLIGFTVVLYRYNEQVESHVLEV